MIWAFVAGIVMTPVLIAADSSLLAGREAAYIVGGMAGILALAVLLLQPLLAVACLPGIALSQARRWHRWTGTALVVAVGIHIGGLYLTSPPDMIDALLLMAPTLYSLFGVIAMWGLILIVLLVAGRSRLRLRAALWRMVHPFNSKDTPPFRAGRNWNAVYITSSC
ncbi:ferric reductase-like transmembrane domain-containing protein [Granulosicoccus antarcticus]|uniref:Ferric oxidoreductase domain-containing protein n=1 Tax=Granulosicoccus antarcticus IMCC3135 TaxID=1192854 RepID=A0A2Z2NLY7_9GAMM|nr:ferric reductase-like transmembrane domain-containing protein [Granulosicoccus antarcticus]ASJ70788.1 hypothetical protein IMCC3135_03375 [Granulosicoccus antarcticus IMCC3135]